MSSTKKLNEGIEHVKEAEKALKTSMFKWSPDYDTAASEYTKAATCFKLAKSLEKSKEACLKAAEMQGQLGALFHSAKLLVQAASLSSDLEQIDEAVDIMDRASVLYREHGSLDTAANTISKAAKMCESRLPDRAVDMYVKAADLTEEDDKSRDALKFLSHASCLEVRHKHFKQASNIMKRQLELVRTIGNAPIGHRIILNLVITCLAEEDIVAAQDAFKLGFDLNGFCESDEAMNCENFVKAFEEGDAELLAKTKSHQNVTHLDTEFAKLAKSLSIADQIGGNNSSTSITAEPSLKSNQVDTQDSVNKPLSAENEWEDGLC